MCVLRKGALLLGFLSLVALSGAKLRWKCELFDTSQETSTRTSFVEFVNNQHPEPNKNNPRITRSTSSKKCRPRPKNGTVGPSTETEKLKIEKKKEVVQQDSPGNSRPADTDAPHVKYQRKPSQESTDLNIGPGFEESNDPYGRSKEPVPRRFRPAELKGADELDKPVTEQLDENVMPDFEFDSDDAPPVQEDLPWCPEEPETTMDCDNVELEKLSMTELIELKQTCEKSVSPDRLKLIEKLIHTEGLGGMVPTTDRTAVLPPTGATNCSENPSNLSNSTLEKYRKECPCEEDTTKMSKEDFEKFKVDCLEPLKVPGDPRNMIRKNGRCAASQQKTDAMSEKEYALFVKECFVGPKKITLKKILVVEKGPECRDVKVEKLSKKEFADYRNKCVHTKDCDDVDQTKLKGKQLAKYKKMCSSVERKTNDICSVENPDDLNDEDFETYKKKCIFDHLDFCINSDINALSDSEYKRYEKECLEIPDTDPSKSPTPESPPSVDIDCENVNWKKMNRKKYFAYKKRCDVDDIDCEHSKDVADKMSSNQFQKFIFECSDQKTCDSVPALSEGRSKEFETECEETKEICDQVSPATPGDDEYTNWLCFLRNVTDCDNAIPGALDDQELEKYEKDCLSPYKDMDCLTVNPKKLTKKQRRRYETKCVKHRPDCRNKNLEELSEEEYEKYRKDCLNENPKFDCATVNPEKLSDGEYRIYEEECQSNCDVDPKKLSKKEYRDYKKNCVKDSSDCRNVVLDDLSEEEYAKFKKDCVKKRRRSNRNCTDVDTTKMSSDEYAEHMKNCLDEDEKDVDCEQAEPKKLSKRQFVTFSEKCVKDKPDCKNLDVREMSDVEYAKYMRDCLRDLDEDLDCETVNPKTLSKQEYNRYKKQCLDREGSDCDDVKPEKLTRKQFKRYEQKCLTRKASSECKDVDVEKLSDEEYEKYKRDCLSKKNTEKLDCGSVEIENLSKQELKKYEKHCLERKSSADCDSVNPDELNDAEYSKYKRDCLTKKRFDCDNVNTEKLSKKEYRRYEKECLKKRRNEECDKLNPDELSDEEYAKYKRDCLEPKSKADCDQIRPDELNDKEYAKYKRDCLDSPSSGSDCKNIVVEELSKKEYKKYKRDCLSEKNPDPDCEGVNVDELSDEEFVKHKKKCSFVPSNPSGTGPGDNVEITKTVVIKNPEGGVSPDGTVTLIKKVVVNNGGPGSEQPENRTACEDVDLEKMTPHEYNAYKKYCKVLYNGEDCDDVRVDKLSEKELREYAEKCGVFCGIDRPEALNKKQKKWYEKNCDGDQDELEKECKDIVFEKLGQRQYGDFAEKCAEQTNACSMLKSRRLVRKVYNQYVSKCKPSIQPSQSVDCTKKTDGMTLEEFKGYTEKCGNGKRRHNCDDVDVEELSEQEFSDYKKKCRINRNTEGCKDVDEKMLYAKEFKRFAKRCGTESTEEDDDCDTSRASKLNKKEYLEFVRKCGRNPADTSLPNCSGVDVENLSMEEFEDYKKRCLKSETTRNVPPGGSGPECKNVNVEKLSDEEYKKHKRKCSTRKTPKPGSEDCDSVNFKDLNDDEYKAYKRRCGKKPTDSSESPEPTPSVTIEKTVRVNKPGRGESSPPDGRIPKKPDGSIDCDNVNVDKLSDDEYDEYKKECRNTRKSSNSDCDNVDLEKMSDEEYSEYKKKCGSSRKHHNHPDADCLLVKIEELSADQYVAYKKRCKSPGKPSKPHHSQRKTPDCSVTDTSQLTEEELEIYQKKCGNQTPESPDSNVPGKPSVTIEKTVVVKKPPTGTDVDDCSSVNVEDLTKEEYVEYKRKCGKQRKTPKPDCDDVDVRKLSDEEYRKYLKRCGDEDAPDGPRAPGDSVTIKKTLVIKEKPTDGTVPPNGHKFDCSVNVDELSDEEYEKYKKECKKTRKTSNSDCDDVDVNKLSKEEYKTYKKRCLENPSHPEESFENVPPNKPNNQRCSDVNIEELSSKEYAEYKERCGKNQTRKPQRPGSPDSSESPDTSKSPDTLDCTDVNVEELNSREYAAYKKRCLKKPNPGNDDCSDVDVDSLSEYEYREYRRRCRREPENVKVQKTVVISEGCQNKSTDGMTKEEFIQCSQQTQKPHVELTKVVKIIEGPRHPGKPDEEFDCFGKDVNTMNDAEYEEFQKKCGRFHKTFQFNCNSDVSKMSDEEFKKFRNACGKKSPFDCETADVDSLTDDEYSRFLRECKENTIDCKNAKVERMSAKKYAEYRKKCVKPTTKSHDDCADVKVEELSPKEYAAYKLRCLKKPEPEEELPSTTRERKKIDCSIVETSKMSKEEYADFKKHCAVKVSTDRYRPGENMILTRKVEIHTGKEKFSCYDRDVDKMSDEEYAEFEKRCLTHPHFRYDCSTVDTTNLSKDEYAEYQKECLKPKSVVLTEKLVVNKTNLPVKNGCYNRNVDAMTDEEYAEYEVRCLGVTPNTRGPTPKKERKSFIDCHNVDLSKLSYSEIEEHVKLCRSQETASTPAPRRRQSLRCSDVNTDNLDEEAYAKWVRECLETSPKTIELEKKKIINSTTALMSGGESVTVEKFEIRTSERPGDDEGYMEGSEDFGVRIHTGVRKVVRGGRPDDDMESETGVILVKKVIHKLPKGHGPYDIEDEDDEGGVVEVKKLIMRTGRREPETDDSEDVEEIVRKPRKQVGPREEVVLLSVTKRHEHPYKLKTVAEEEEPTEIVQLKKNTRNPDKVLREVRIRKKFRQGVPEEETLVQEIGGPDFRIVRKTVMVPRRVRKMKSTTTTTTTPAEPEYYYDEEEVPEEITLVKTGQSTRPLRKTVRPLDEDEEFVDVREEQPESFIEFEGFVKVHGTPRKLRKKPKYTDSGEEPDIREVTRKVVMQPGGEEDDLKGVKLRSHRKQLRKKVERPDEFPEDREHEVTVVKKLKILKFDQGEKETYDDMEDVDEDGQVIVRNRKRQYMVEKRRPEEDEYAEEEVVEGRVAVKGRAPKRYRLRGDRPERKRAQPKIEEETPQFYRIGGEDEEKHSRVDEKKKMIRRREGVKRRRRPDESEESRRKPRFEEESEEFGRRKRPGRVEEEEESGRRRQSRGKDMVMEKIRKFYRIGPNGEKELIPKDDEGESITLKKKKVIKYGAEKRDVPEGNDDSEEIRLLKRKKFYRIGPDGKRELIRTEGDEPRDGEEVKVSKKNVYRIGPDGKRRLVTEGSEQPIAMDQPAESGEEVIKKEKRKIYKVGPDGKRQLAQDEDETEQPGEDKEEIVMKKKKRFYRVGPNGKRELIRTEGDDSPTENDGEEVKLMKKKKFFKIGPDGKRELIRTEEDGGDNKKHMLGERKSSFSLEPLNNDKDSQDGEEIVMHKKKRFYKIGPDGKRELIRTEGDVGHDAEGDGEVMKVMKKKRVYRIGPDGKRTLVNDGSEVARDGQEEKLEDEDGEKITMKKRRKFYRVGPDGKRQLIREEEGDRHGDNEQTALLGRKKSTYSPEPLKDGEEVMMHKKKRFYKIGPDGKRELIRTEDGNKKPALLGEKKSSYSQEPLNDEKDVDLEGDEIKTHKKKRFYKIGPDGKRELIRTEGDSTDAGDSHTETEDMGVKKTRRFYKIGKDGKRELVRTEGGDDEKKIQKMPEGVEPEKQMDKQTKNPKAKSVTRRGFFKGGPLELTDSQEEGNEEKKEEKPSRKVGSTRKRLQGDEPGEEGFENERGPRKKRTDETEHEKPMKKNVDLGKLLKPKKLTDEDGMIEKSSGGDNEKLSDTGSSVNGAQTTRRYHKYHREDHLRASGTSEEEIPDPK